MKLDVDSLDFDRCEDEKIHLPESIQSYGYLFALDRLTGEIKIVSENVCDLFAIDDLHGRNFFDVLIADNQDYAFLRESYERARARNTRLPVRIRFKSELITKGSVNDFLAVVYDSGEYFVIELEPAAKFQEVYSAEHYIKVYAMSVAPKFKSYKSLSDMAQEMVDTIRYISDMERVVLYKFNEDASGKVVAESRVDDIDSYLDLYYPANDIPQQARELYKKNWVRLTPNVDLEPCRLIPDIKTSGRKPLDMTLSLLRSLSPIHNQYIRNQGLKASFSMSLVAHDKLWGIISCHSREPRYIPQNVRLQCENLSQLFSWHLAAKEEQLYIEKKVSIEGAVDKMLDRLSPTRPIVDIFKENEEHVLRIMEADGFIFYSEQTSVFIGQTPDLEAVKKVYRQKEVQQGKPVAFTDLSSVVDDEASLNGIRGMLLIPMLEKRNFFTAWFRKELRQVQKWAGSPKELDASGSKLERLTPRKSFQIHVREIIGQSREWDQNDVDAASRFNRFFLAYALENQEKMRRNLDNLEKQDRHKNEFLATLAHELRNPLSPISMSIALLERDKSEKSVESVVSIMKRQVGHMTRLVNDLMDVSRITRGKIVLEKTRVALLDIVNSAIESCQRSIEEKGHTLDLDLPSEKIFVDGDETRLAQIFSNILNNAVKYTDPGGKISVSAKISESVISICIKDNGIGMPADKLEDIFTMFTQINAGSTDSKGGLGIGLTLVEKLVDLHGGEIFVRSDGANKGSEFEVLLPRADARSDSIPVVMPGSKVSHQGERMKLLVVDDNEDIAITYTRLFEMMGYEVLAAHSGEEALERFDNFKPDFALLDIGLPGIDGYELCRRLAARPAAQDTVFFSQSGWGSKQDEAKAHAAGFKKHFVKPVSVEALRAELQKSPSDTA